MELDKETEEETSKKKMREEGREENETVSAKRRCVGSVYAETFDIFGQGEDSESCGGFSWGDLLKNPDDLSDCEPETRTDVSAVPHVTVVPQRISHYSTDVSQWQEELEAQSFWSIQERRVMAAMDNYLKNDDMKVETKALELLMDPEDSEVCLRYILAHAKRRGSRIFEIFSTREN